MRKRINIKALGILLAIGAVAAASTHVLHGYQVRTNAGILLAQANRAEERGKFDTAANYLSRYLALVPEDVDARAKYALSIADPRVANSPKALMRAFLVLSRAVQLAPERNDVRRRLIDVAMNPRLQRFADAAAHLDKLPLDGDLLSLRARCCEETGSYAEARNDYRQAIAATPSELENYQRLADLLRTKADVVRRKKTSTTAEETVDDMVALADKTIMQMVEANPRNADAYLIRARYRQKTAAPNVDPEQLRAQVEPDLREAQRLAPDTVTVILAIAELERQRKNAAAARDVLRRGIQQHPREWSLVQALSRVEVLDEKLDAAVSVLRDGLKVMPDQLDLLWNYAHLLIHKKQDEEAARAVARLRKAGMPRPEMDYLQARIDFNHERWLKAQRTLEQVYPLLLKDHDQRKDWFSFNLALECSLMLGICYEHLGDPYRAATAYGRMVARDPSSVAGRQGHARMNWALGQLDSAEQEYRQLVSQYTVPPNVWVELAQLLIVRNRQNENADWKQVLQVLAAAEKQREQSRPSALTIKILRAEVMAAQSEYEAARWQLEQGHDNKKTRPEEVWVGLARLEMQRGKADAAEAVLDEAAKNLGDRLELRLARARLWAWRGGPEAAKALVPLGQGTEGFSEADQLRLLRALAQAHGEALDYPGAMRLWQQVAERRENDLGSRFTLFELAVVTGDEPAMRKYTQAIKEIEGEPEGTLWRYCLACQYLWHAEHGDKSRLAEAASLLKLVSDRRSAWARVALAQGAADDLLGKPHAAVANYKRAVMLGEQRPDVIKQLVQILTRRGYHLAAEQMIRRLRAQSPGLLVGLERPAAEVAMFKGELRQALELARQAVPPDSKDYRGHIWLSQLLWAADMPDEGLASLRRALALNDQAPEVWVALVQHLVRTKDKKQAEAVIQQAEQKLPRGTADLELAQCHDMVGNTERARPLYEAAFAARPQDVNVLRELATFAVNANRLDEAKARLNAIRQLKNSPPEAVAWANQRLAVLTASDGGNQNLQAALALLGVTGDDVLSGTPSAANLGDVRAKITILANQPSARKRKQAIALLEGLHRTHRITVDEQFLLAKLHESVGDWHKTRTLITDLLTTVAEKRQSAPTTREKSQWQSVYPTYLADYCAMLLRRNELTDARAWQAKLEHAEPDSPRSWDIKARLLAKQGKGATVVPGLKKLGEQDPALLVSIARLLEQIGQTAAAQEMFEKHVATAKEPQRLLVLAAFFGRQNRPGDALDLCERAWQTCPPTVVASTSVAALYAAKTPEPHANRVVERLQAAIAAHPDQPALLSHLAAVRRLQGRHDDAIALLRQVADRDKSDSVVRNNLAWLLALKGHADEALAAVADAITLRGEQVNLLDTRAVAYIVKGKHGLAVKDLEEAIAEAPTPGRYFHLAQAHFFGTHNLVAARDAWQRARGLGLTDTSVDQLERGTYRQLKAQLDRP